MIITSRLLSFSVLLVLYLAPCLAQAGHIWLRNGDRVEGEFAGMDAQHIQWASSLLGELKIERKQLRGFSSNKRFDVDFGGGGLGRLKNCLFAYAPGVGQWLHCDEDSTMVSSLGAVSSVAEYLPPRGEEMSITGLVHLTADSSSGNTDSETYKFGADTRIRMDSVRHSIGVKYDTERTSNLKSKDERRLDYQYDYFISPVWFVTGQSSWQSNEFKDLDRRLTGGIGAGYQFFDTEKMKLSAESGLSYVQERFREADDRDRYTMRWALDFYWDFDLFGSTLNHKHELFQPLRETEDFEIQSTTSISLPIRGALKSLLLLEYDYDNLPAEDKRKFDRKVSLGLSYQW